MSWKVKTEWHCVITELFYNLSRIGKGLRFPPTYKLSFMNAGRKQNS